MTRTSGSFRDPAIAGETRFGILAFLGMAMYLTVLMLLEKAGMPDRTGFVLTGIMLVAVFAISGIVARTSQITEWQVSARMAAPLILGMSLAATGLPGSFLVGLPGGFFADNASAAVYLLAPLAGIAWAAVLVAPYIRKSEATAPAGVLRLRYASRFPAGLVIVATCIAAILLMWSQFRLAGLVAAIVFKTDPASSAAIAAALTAVSVIPGGLRGLLRTNALALVLILLAFLAPLIWLATIATGLPVPQLAYGQGALAPIMELEQQLNSVGIPPLSKSMLNGLPAPSGIQLAFLAAFLLSAFVAYPPLLAQFVGARRVDSTRLATAWAILLGALVLTAAPAAAAFAKIAIYDGIFGLTAGEIGKSAAWLLAYGGAASADLSTLPLVTLCGRPVADLASAIAACGGNPDYALGPADLGLRSELIVLGLAEITRIPSAFTMALGAGSIAATIACANGAAFTVSTVLSLGGPASGLNRVFLARAATAAGIMASAYLAMELQIGPIEPLMWSLAICAGALTPAYLLAIWWDRMTWISASAGLLGSLASMTGIAMMAFVGPDMVAMNGDETILQFPLLLGLPLAVTAGLVGLACGLLVAGLFALVPARRPGSGELELLRVPDVRPAGEDLGA